MCPRWDLSESSSESGNFTRLTDCMSSLFATWDGFGVIVSKTSLWYGLDLHSP